MNPILEQFIDVRILENFELVRGKALQGLSFAERREALEKTNRFTDAAYYANSDYRQCNISGTSMASPQVAGVAACILQMNPSWSPARVKQWLLDNAGSAILNTGTGNDWTNDRSLKGGDAKVLHMPFTESKPVSISGFSNLTFNVKVKS